MCSLISRRCCWGPQVRFILMNSFSTSDDTKEHLRKKHGELIDEEDSELVQNKSPKVDAKTLKPAEHPANRDQEWCVPVGSFTRCFFRNATASRRPTDRMQNWRL